MLDKKMRRITKNRLKEKYRRLCVSCNESPDGFQGVQREIISHLSSAIDTIEAKPGVKLTDASCTESWTDILFKDPADEEEATAVCEVLAPAHHETGHDVTDDVGGLSRSIDVGADLGNAADADEGNPIFQFLASSPVFRSAVNSALGYAGQSRRGSDGVGAPMDDTVILEHGSSNYLYCSLFKL